MARILIVPFHFTSGLNGALTVARRLRDANHEVTFGAVADCEDRIREAAFAYEQILPRSMPKGFTHEMEKLKVSGVRALVRRLTAVQSQIHEELRDVGLGPALQSQRFDLMMGSSDLPEATVAAASLKTRLACFSLTPVPLESLGLPPLGTSLFPQPGWRYPFDRFRAWRFRELTRRIERLMGANNPKTLYGALARRHGFPLEKLRFDVDFAQVRLDIPHLVLWPKAFDFEGAQDPPGSYRLESTAEPDEVRSGDFPWDQVPEDKPLVYCGLGLTGTFVHPGLLERIFDSFLDALSARPHWTGVIATGKQIELPPGRIPPNVIVRPHVPQLKVLARASLFVTQAGPTSVCEAAMFGVPMLAIPLFHDQFGVAVRLALRDLALYGPHPECHKIGQWMDEVMQDPMYKRRAAEAASELKRLREQKLTALAVEDLLRAPLP